MYFVRIIIAILIAHGYPSSDKEKPKPWYFTKTMVPTTNIKLLSIVLRAYQNDLDFTSRTFIFNWLNKLIEVKNLISYNKYALERQN